MPAQATIKCATALVVGLVLFLLGSCLASPLETLNITTTDMTTFISNSTTENSTTSNELAAQVSSRRARILDDNDFESRGNKSDTMTIQGRILTGENSRLYEDNSFQNLETAMMSTGDHQLPTIYGHITPTNMETSLKTISVQASIPTMEAGSASYSYASPTATGLGSYDGHSFGVQPSDIMPFYYDHHSSAQHGSRYEATKPAPLYTLVPVHLKPPTLKDAMFDALFKMKKSFSGTFQRVKNAFGWNSFAEKVSGPDTLAAVAPVAAGILAGGLAAAYFNAKNSRNGSGNITTTDHGILGKIFGKKRSVRGVTEEDLMHVVSRLDPLQRQYLEQLQFFGPRRWRDPNCAKMIFCDVMSRAGPLQLLDAQRRIGSFLSRMEERTARYVESMIKDVMLGLAARDCSRFSCAEPHGPDMFGPPRPPPTPIQPFPGNNFLRKLRLAAGA